MHTGMDLELETAPLKRPHWPPWICSLFSECKYSQTGLIWSQTSHASLSNFCWRPRRCSSIRLQQVVFLWTFLFFFFYIKSPSSVNVADCCWKMSASQVGNYSPSQKPLALKMQMVGTCCRMSLVSFPSWHLKTGNTTPACKPPFSSGHVHWGSDA